MQPKRISRKDIIVASIVLALSTSLLLGQVEDRSRELANRSTCAANLRGITQSMNVYAADGDWYPCLPPWSATTYDVTFKEDAGNNDPGEVLTKMWKDKKYSNNPSANLWIMVLTGQVAPKQFICRSDPFATPGAATNKDTNWYFNFQDQHNVSYSSAFPWVGSTDKATIGGIWHNDTDASLPIITDMAPYFGRTAEDFKDPAPVTPTPEERAKTDRLINDLASPDFATREQASKELAAKGADAFPGLREAVAASTDFEVRSRVLPMLGSSRTQNWLVTKANSGIHDFEGQNVGFGDGHAEFARTPNMGENGDSMWGIIKDPAANRVEIPIAAGALPHAPTGSMGNWDVVMVPTRDAKGELK